MYNVLTKLNFLCYYLIARSVFGSISFMSGSSHPPHMSVGLGQVRKLQHRYDAICSYSGNNEKKETEKAEKPSIAQTHMLWPGLMSPVSPVSHTVVTVN